MSLRLWAGTINARPDEDGWRNYTLDMSNRGVWDVDLGMSVAPDFVCDITCMPIFRDDMWDEVVLHHVLEHLPRANAPVALDEIRRILKPDGILDIEVPDMDAICAAWVSGEHPKAMLQQWVYGEQLGAHELGDNHRFGWTEVELRETLADAGFRPGARLADGLAVRFRCT